MIHLFADVAFAGGAVLCVGPDDHAAIEVGHLSPDCEPLRPSGLHTGIGDAYSTSGDCAECTDIPLHSEAEMASEPLSWNPDVAAILPDVRRPDPLRYHEGEAPTVPSGGLSPTLRAHRSIVLLI